MKKIHNSVSGGKSTWTSSTFSQPASVLLINPAADADPLLAAVVGLQVVLLPDQLHIRRAVRVVQATGHDVPVAHAVQAEGPLVRTFRVLYRRYGREWKNVSECKRGQFHKNGYFLRKSVYVLMFFS
jgi:hypothetical protein